MIKTLEINNVKRIVLIFEYNRKIIDFIKTIDGINWSATKKFWHIPFKKNVISKIKNPLRRVKFG